MCWGRDSVVEEPNTHALPSLLLLCERGRLYSEYAACRSSKCPRCVACALWEEEAPQVQACTAHVRLGVRHDVLCLGIQRHRALCKAREGHRGTAQQAVPPGRRRNRGGGDASLGAHRHNHASATAIPPKGVRTPHVFTLVKSVCK